jgi:hypothetical protein
MPGPDDVRGRMGQHAIPSLPHHEGPQQPHLVRTLHQRPQVKKLNSLMFQNSSSLISGKESQQPHLARTFHQ